MKKILISGESSYIGTSFIEWVKTQKRDDCKVDTINLRNDSWKEKELGDYDAIIHLAAIVHAPSANPSLYYTVNRDLAFEFAKKAKNDGVKHFILFSSLSVYGEKVEKIDKSTKPKPSSHYGKSKYEAEIKINHLVSENFKLTILRPPIVYGSRAPGNFMRLLKLFDIIPIFIKMNNSRSMMFIDDLSFILYSIISNETSGIFIPQNNEYVSTLEIFKKYREIKNKKYIIIPIKIPKVLISRFPLLNKVLGDLTVSKEISLICDFNSQTTFNESLIKTLNK